MPLEPVVIRVNSANASGIAASIDGLLEPASLRATSVISCGVRMPATTSSPWALIRNSPVKPLLAGRRIAREGDAGRRAVAMLPNTMACTLTRCPALRMSSGGDT